jgi:hypothetical protein
MADNNGASKYAVYWYRSLCLETEKANVFWSGSTVKESEISNIAAYNRANGIMWLVFSLVMWISTILGVMNMKAGGILLIAGCIIGVPLLPIVYGKIYRNYKK